MSRKLVLIGAVAFFVGIGTLVASFVAKPAQIIQGVKIFPWLQPINLIAISFLAVIVQVAGAFLILVAFVLFGWHICGGGGQKKSQKKVLKTKNRSKRPHEISSSNYGLVVTQRDKCLNSIQCVLLLGMTTTVVSLMAGWQSSALVTALSSLDTRVITDSQDTINSNSSSISPSNNSTNSSSSSTPTVDTGTWFQLMDMFTTVSSSLSSTCHPCNTTTGELESTSTPVDGWWPVVLTVDTTGPWTASTVPTATWATHSATTATCPQVIPYHTLCHHSNMTIMIISGSLMTGQLRSSMKRPSQRDTSSVSSANSKKSLRFGIGAEQTAV